MQPNWIDLRAAIVRDPLVAYLNTGSYGLTPQVVFDKANTLRRLQQQSPVDFLWRRGGEYLWESRTQLADFLGADPLRLIFTLNVSSAINLVAWSLPIAAPGDVLMTDHEYGAMHFAWERTAQRLGLNLRYATLPILPREPAQLVDSIVSQITPRTRLLFLSHVLHTTGMVLPVREICREARKRGVVTVIDGAHAPGMLSLRLDEIGCDFYAANLHKWLLAPLGAGFLYVTEGMQDRIQPINVSWGWHYDRAKAHERGQFGGTHWQRSFEFEGSRDVCSWLAVPTAIAFHNEIGPERIRARHRELSDYARKQLGRIVEVATPDHGSLRGGLTAFRLPDIDGQKMRSHLWDQHKIEINVLEFAHGQYLRVSTHFYNLEEEIDLLARSLPAAIAAGK